MLHGLLHLLKLNRARGHGNSSYINNQIHIQYWLNAVSSENLCFILFFCSERDKTLCNSLAYLTHTSISLSVSIPSFSCISFSLQPLKAGDHLQSPGLLKVSSHWGEFSCRRISWFSLWLCKSLRDAFG